jgi:cytochrome P450
MLFLHQAAVKAPGPKGNFFVGNLREMFRDPLTFLDECAGKYGDVIQMRIGATMAFLINEPDLIEEVLLTNNRNFTKLRLGTVEVFGDGLLVSQGDIWLRDKRMMNPAFHKERISAYAKIVTESVNEECIAWKNGEERDIHFDMSALTLKIIAKSLFSTDLLREEQNEIIHIFNALLMRSTIGLRLFPQTTKLPLPANIRFRRNLHRLNEIVYHMIEARKKNRAGFDDLLSLLLDGAENDPTISDKQLRDEVVTMLSTGYETSSTTLAWIFYLLSQHPEAEEKLAQELDSVLKGCEPSFDDIHRLPYTSWVVKEALRVYPTGWILGRKAISDCMIGGYHVPAKAMILMSQWTMHRDARWFDQPLAFNPDRWNDGLEKRIPKFAYFPFGGGPRKCIGDTFAIMETTLILAMISSRMKLQTVAGHPVVSHALLTLRPKFGMRMEVNAR